MEEQPCYSVGLGGDGDEIAAIQDVERAFGIILDTRDAPRWATAGDVFTSLIKELSPEAASDPATWDRFAEALSGQTGIDPNLITKNSPLLLPKSVFWARIQEVWAVLLWSVIGILLVAYLLVYVSDL